MSTVLDLSYEQTSDEEEEEGREGIIVRSSTESLVACTAQEASESSTGSPVPKRQKTEAGQESIDDDLQEENEPAASGAVLTDFDQLSCDSMSCTRLFGRPDGEIAAYTDGSVLMFPIVDHPLMDVMLPRPSGSPDAALQVVVGLVCTGVASALTLRSPSQRKIVEFHKLRQQGRAKSINEKIRHSRNFKNPYMLNWLVSHCGTMPCSCAVVQESVLCSVLRQRCGRPAFSCSDRRDRIKLPKEPFQSRCYTTRGC